MSCILKCTEHGLNRNNHSLEPPALIVLPVFKSPQQKPCIHHRERKERKRQKELTHLDQGGSTKNRNIIFRKTPLKHYSGCDPRTLFQKITPGSVFESVFCLRNPAPASISTTTKVPYGNLVGADSAGSLTATSFFQLHVERLPSTRQDPF